MRSLRAAPPERITPSSSTIPARYISATTSMIPEPQIPVTAASAPANPGASDHASFPMIR